MRLIDADILLKSFAESNHIKETSSGLDVMEMLAIKEIIDNAPTIEIPKGEWLDIYESHIAYECSNCHRQMPVVDFYFCPNCGAQMHTKEMKESK